MAKEFMHKTIKELFPDYVVLIKIGTFYESYGDDANMLSILDRKCINYLVVDRSHNYEEEFKENYKRKNNYKEILKDANNLFGLSYFFYNF